MRMDKAINLVRDALLVLSSLGTAGVLALSMSAAGESAKAQKKVLDEMAEHLYLFAPAEAATVAQLAQIRDKCPDWLLPANPEWVNQDQAAMLLTQCAGKPAKVRQELLLDIKARRLQALVAQEQPGP